MAARAGTEAPQDTPSTGWSPGGPGMGGPGPGGMGGSSRPSLRRAFVSLKSRDFRLLFFSMLAAMTAMNVQMLARAWLAYELSGSFTTVGVIMISFGIPMLLFSLIGGATADRMDKRNLIIVTQFGSGVLALATAVMITTGVIDADQRLSIPILFAMGLLHGTLMAFQMPPRQAMIAELVPQHQLMNAFAINAAGMSLSRMLAPVAVGVMIATLGVHSAYYLQAMMLLVTLVFMAMLPKSTSHLAGADARGSMLHEIAGGLRYVAHDRTLLLLTFMGTVPMALGFSHQVLLPGFVVDELGLPATAWGLIGTISGVGAVVGSFAIASLTDFPRKPLLQMLAGVGFGLGLLLMGVASKAFGFPGALGGVIVMGVFMNAYMTLNMTMVMTHTRPEYYGRVMSIFMQTFALMPLSAFPMGIVADEITASSTFALLGVAIVAFMALIFALNPRYVVSRLTTGPAGERGSLGDAAWAAMSSGGGGGGFGGGMGMPGRPGMRPGGASAQRAMSAGSTPDASAVLAPPPSELQSD